jgi:hypothetical protein
MAEKATTMNGNMENRAVEGKIRRRIQTQCEASLSSFLIPFQRMIGGAC